MTDNEVRLSLSPSAARHRSIADLSVSFYKRAQILVADIWGCFNGHGEGHFIDMVCSELRRAIGERLMM